MTVRPFVYSVCDQGFYDRFGQSFLNSARAHGHEAELFCDGEQATEATKSKYLAWRYQLLPELLEKHPAVLMVDIDSVFTAPVEIEDEYDVGAFMRPNEPLHMRTLGSIVYVTDKAKAFAWALADGLSNGPVLWYQDQVLLWNTLKAFGDRYRVKVFDESVMSWRDPKAPIYTGKGPRKDSAEFGVAVEDWKGRDVLISEPYRKLNAQLHTQLYAFGASSARWVERVANMIETEGHQSVLDYGCGKGLLAKGLAERGHKIAEFDPAIPGKEETPEPADLVVCTDVLEHIEPVHINAVLRELKRLTNRKLFVNVACKEALMRLPDGRSTHLIVKPAEWWKEKLAKHFRVVEWETRGTDAFGELVPLVLPKRRPITTGIAKFADGIIDHINKYSDPFFQVKSWSTYERASDKPADLQLAIRILEHLPDPDAAMDEICKLARKCVACMIELGDGRTAEYWRDVMNRHIRIARFDEGTKGIIVIGSPKVVVQNLNIVGAMGADEEWKQLLVNIERIKARIEPAPAHGRRALLACYGPSLAANIDILKKYADGGGDVVSVSGAHDFLIEHGIVPKYHVECDPRAHKADNIKAASPGTTYMLASSCHAAMFDKLEGADIRLWHIAAGEHTVRLIKEMGEKPGTVIGGGSSVGLRSIPLLYALGYRDFAVFGMDSSFSDDGKQWAGKHAGKLKQVRPARVGDRMFMTSAVMVGYACQFFELVQKVDDITWELIGDGLLQEMAKHYANGTLETAA